MSDRKPIWRPTLGPQGEPVPLHQRMADQAAVQNRSSSASHSSVFGRSIWKLSDSWSHCLDSGWGAGGPLIQGRA